MSCFRPWCRSIREAPGGATPCNAMSSEHVHHTPSTTTIRGHEMDRRMRNCGEKRGKSGTRSDRQSSFGSRAFRSAPSFDQLSTSTHTSHATRPEVWQDDRPVTSGLTWAWFLSKGSGWPQQFAPTFEHSSAELHRHQRQVVNRMCRHITKASSSQ